MAYRFLVLDLDGTLLNAQKELTSVTRQAIFQAREAGVCIVLASGRPTYGVAPIADALEMDRKGGYVLAFNGGVVTDWQTKQKLVASELSADMVPYLYERVQNSGFTLITYRDRYIITENPNDTYVQFEARLNRMELLQVENLEAAVGTAVPKCLITGEPDRLVMLEADLKAALAGRAEVYRSEPFFLEIMPLGIDKARSLERLLQLIGGKREELVACGDGFNDLSMIRYAGLGVAMANAQPAVRDAADFVTLSNEEDGVAHVVRKFML